MGNIIFGNVHISFDVNIKNFSIISNFCDLGHNLIAGNYITIMPTVTIGGNCNIGELTLIGSGANIYQGAKIGKNCKIGMGSLITNNLHKTRIDHRDIHNPEVGGSTPPLATKTTLYKPRSCEHS